MCCPMNTKKKRKSNISARKKTAGGNVMPKLNLQEVDAGTCLKIVIETTPVGESNDSSQELRELGVINDDQAAIHREKIQKRMEAEGGAIDPNKISSGPDITVADCAASVFENQDEASTDEKMARTSTIAKPALKKVGAGTCLTIVVETTPVGKSNDPSQK